METIGRVICYGVGKAPAASWHCEKHVGINRLYYIHSGKGYYEHLGKRYPFVNGYLYFIPYTANFTPFCEMSDPIIHTYIDFELIPPIITNKIIAMEAKKSEKVLSAQRVFVLGGETSEHCNLFKVYEDAVFWELCKASIIYLVNQIVKENEIEKITDETVIRALEAMHTRMKERLTVNCLARENYMAPDTFIRRFSQVVGITPYAYLKNLRLRTAQCLRESGMNLSQIASEVGYTDAISLSHALKNERMRAD